MADINLYQIILEDPLNGDQFELQPIKWELNEELNKEQTAKFTLSYEYMLKMANAYDSTVLNIFTAKYREIYINRKDSNGVYQKIFWGVLSDFSQAPKGEGAQEFQLTAISWFGLFARRIAGVPKTEYTSDDAGAIAWDLIDVSQASDPPYSDLGITEGTIDASVNRDRTYRFDNIKDSIYRLSRSNLEDGFDFEIDNTKAFNVYYPKKGSDKFDVVFDARTLANWSYKKPLLLTLANRVHVVGKSTNDDVLYVTRNGTNGNKADWTLLEAKVDESDTESQTLLEDKGDRELANKEIPITEFTAEHYDYDDNVKINWFSYLLGDNVKANFPEIGMESATKRVIKKSLTLDAGKSIGYIKTVLDLVQ